MSLILPSELSSSNYPSADVVVVATVLTSGTGPCDRGRANKPMMMPYCDDMQFHLSQTMVSKRHCCRRMPAQRLHDRPVLISRCYGGKDGHESHFFATRLHTSLEAFKKQSVGVKQ